MASSSAASQPASSASVSLNTDTLYHGKGSLPFTDSEPTKVSQSNENSSTSSDESSAFTLSASTATNQGEDPSTNSDEPSKLPQSAGNSSPSDSSSSLDTNEDIIIVHEEGSSQDDGDEEEEEECGFCIFMKGGGCKEPFIAWEKCVEEAEKLGEDVVNKCMDVTSQLKKCMDENANYYEPILRVERQLTDTISEDNTSKPEKEPEKEPKKEPEKEPEKEAEKEPEKEAEKEPEKEAEKEPEKEPITEAAK